MLYYLSNRILVSLAYRVELAFDRAQEIQSLSSLTMSYENLCALKDELL